MSPQRIRTTEVDELVHEEALRRVEYRSNKQIAQMLEAKGIRLSHRYIERLVQGEVRRLRKELRIGVDTHHPNAAK